MLGWYDSDLGRYALQREQAWFDAVSGDLFGFVAVQVGGCDIDFLRANRMPHRYRVCPRAGHVRAGAEDLPFDGQSLDLLALPHALEFAEHPHQVLREAERVLRPEGRLLISGFNPRSLWGLQRTLRGARAPYPWHGRFLTLTRLKDWLALLGFELAGGRMACYAPPINRMAWLSRFALLEAAGDRWWALGGGVYLLHAVKRVHGMRIIAPRWDTGWRTRATFAQPTRNSSKIASP